MLEHSATAIRGMHSAAHVTSSPCPLLPASSLLTRLLVTGAQTPTQPPAAARAAAAALPVVVILAAIRSSMLLPSGGCWRRSCGGSRALLQQARVPEQCSRVP